MRIFIDIETQPTTNPNRIRELAASVQPPGNITRQESRDSWLSEKAPQAIEEAISKTALDATDGEIISIAFSEDDGDPTVLCQHPSEYDEAALLRTFVSKIEALTQHESIPSVTKDEAYRFAPWWIGHNTSFDLGFLWRRMAIHGIPARGLISNPSDIRHGKDHFCTMTAWAGHRDRISLDRLCKALGVKSPKDGVINGAMAWRFWRSGEVDQVKDYNARDVIATRDIFQKLEAINGR